MVTLGLYSTKSLLTRLMGEATAAPARRAIDERAAIMVTEDELRFSGCGGVEDFV